jgi:D-sedoheptulose 7-phosphate isomerase
MDIFSKYAFCLQDVLKDYDWVHVRNLAEALRVAWQEGKGVYICGNGGSAANAMHFANDLVYGVAPGNSLGLRANALVANQSVLTCVANDIDYENVFSYQLETSGEKGDILIALSGSGNSANIINAIKKAREMGVQTFAVLGYSGGEALELVDVAIHFPINDMQIAEDCQQIVNHMVMRWLKENPVSIRSRSGIESQRRVESVSSSKLASEGVLIQEDRAR